MPYDLLAHDYVIPERLQTSIPPCYLHTYSRKRSLDNLKCGLFKPKSVNKSQRFTFLQRLHNLYLLEYL